MMLCKNNRAAAFSACICSLQPVCLTVFLNVDLTLTCSSHNGRAETQRQPPEGVSTHLEL